MTFEVFRRRGRTWSFAGTYNAPDSRTAARQFHRWHHVKRVAVRPADTTVRPYIYNFNPKGNHATDVH